MTRLILPNDNFVRAEPDSGAAALIFRRAWNTGGARTLTRRPRTPLTPPNCAVSFEDCASPRSPLFSKPLQAARPGPETKLIVCRYKKMDLSKRQLLQEALVKAEAHHAYIAVSTPSGTRILLRPDFTCYETYVEGTDADGQLLTLTYEQIAAVDVE